MFGNKMIANLFILGLSSTLSCAYANSLTIVNNTDFDSTAIINHGVCSTILGEKGITRAHTTNVVPEGKLKMACLMNKENCVADVYATANCKGPVIATAVFSITTGMKGQPQVKDKRFDVVATGFTVVLNQKPSK